MQWREKQNNPQAPEEPVPEAAEKVQDRPPSIEESSIIDSALQAFGFAQQPPTPSLPSRMVSSPVGYSAVTAAPIPSLPPQIAGYNAPNGAYGLPLGTSQAGTFYGASQSAVPYGSSQVSTSQ